MAKNLCRNFCIFWSQRVLNAPVKTKSFVFTGALSTFLDQKMQKFLHAFSAMWWVWGVSEGYVAVYGGIRRCLTAKDRIWDPKSIWAQMDQMGLGRPKTCIFFVRNFCRLCLWVQILFGGVSDPKRAGRVQSVCQNKFEPHTTLQSWDFAFWVKKKRAFPPPVNKWGSSFKIGQQMM